MSGHTDLHEQLEEELATFVNKEAAYVLNFGYQGILSTIDTLVSKNDIIVYDVDSHACIIDGVRLHPGKRYTYKHNDIVSLEKNLERATIMAEKTGGGILVISERSKAIRASVILIPFPSSTTWIKSFPASLMINCTWLEPASIAFSINSLTTEAGR